MDDSGRIFGALASTSGNRPCTTALDCRLPVAVAPTAMSSAISHSCNARVRRLHTRQRKTSSAWMRSSSARLTPRSSTMSASAS
ncbi:hypothetical protein V5799_006512 [Amblyomma americanum]|uniref:Uncharacterized protein n=1 Tax=Amblyomma americanum TaxID=6943 RepID=A0AAQ4DW73_AMBAM